MVWSIKRLRGYLRGTKFKVFTDSSALQNIGKIADHNPRVSRWVEFLGAYTYTVHHRPGTQNGNADMLSRLPLPATEEDRSGRARLTYPGTRSPPTLFELPPACRQALHLQVLVWVG